MYNGKLVIQIIWKSSSRRLKCKNLLSCEPEAESKEKHCVWDYNLTFCPLQCRLQHIYHWQPCARDDLYPMPESTWSPSQGPRIWPLLLTQLCCQNPAKIFGYSVTCQLLYSAPTFCPPWVSCRDFKKNSWFKIYKDDISQGILVHVMNPCTSKSRDNRPALGINRGDTNLRQFLKRRRLKRDVLSGGNGVGTAVSVVRSYKLFLSPKQGLSKVLRRC